MKRNANSSRKQSGISLVESLISIAVTLIAVGTTAPGFDSARAAHRIKGAAAQLETDIQQARSMAVTSNKSMRISFKADNNGTCYIVHNGSSTACTCDARGAAICTGGATAVRSVRFEASQQVQVTSNSASLVFDAAKGTVSPTATMRLVGEGGRGLNLVINVMGRVRTCSPSKTIPGYPKC
jgi:type IV fimbrial biogenesis protein FimT